MKDPYIQENGTLKNKLGIKEYDDLNKAERDIGFVKLIDVNKAFKKRYCDIWWMPAIFGNSYNR